MVPLGLAACVWCFRGLDADLGRENGTGSRQATKIVNAGLVGLVWFGSFDG